jgi:hypothetical protein
VPRKCRVDSDRLKSCMSSVRFARGNYWSLNSVKDKNLPARVPYQGFQEYRTEQAFMIISYKHLLDSEDNNDTKRMNSQRSVGENM